MTVLTRGSASAIFLVKELESRLPELDDMIVCVSTLRRLRTENSKGSETLGGIKLLFVGLLVFTLFYNFCLFLEWSGITEALDTLEDFIGALVPLWWAFVLYAFLQEMAVCDLHQSGECLRLEVIERERAEEKAREAEALKELDRLRDQLLANISHELRTPLASIKGFVSTLLQPDVKWSDEQQRDFLETIGQETDRLTRLISDLLDMSRIEARELKLEKRALLKQFGSVQAIREAPIEELATTRGMSKNLAQKVKEYL